MDGDRQIAGRDLDYRVALDVMGWSHDEGKPMTHYWHDPTGEYADLPFYSADGEAAGLVFEAMISLCQVRGDRGLTLRWFRDRCYVVAWTGIENIDADPVEAIASADTLPLAICRAALIWIQGG